MTQEEIAEAFNLLNYAFYQKEKVFPEVIGISKEGAFFAKGIITGSEKKFHVFPDKLKTIITLEKIKEIKLEISEKEARRKQYLELKKEFDVELRPNKNAD